MKWFCGIITEVDEGSGKRFVEFGDGDKGWFQEEELMVMVKRPRSRVAEDTRETEVFRSTPELPEAKPSVKKQ